MKVWAVVKLDEKGIGEVNKMRYFDDNGGLPEGNYSENDIAGKWVMIEGKIEVEDKITYAYREVDNTTLIKVD
ncbi:MAG: hypothetical protein ACOC2W_02520 [bacterium]